MRTTKPAVILLALVLLTAAAVQPAEAMDKPKISDTLTASCLVKITSDPVVLPLSDIVIDYLLHSSGVAGKAAREVLNISPDDAFHLFRIEDVAKYSAALPRSSRSTTKVPILGDIPLLGPTTAAAARQAAAATIRRPAEPMTMRRGPRVEGILGNTALISGRWCKVGDNIGGAKVLEIKPTYVKVEWQGQQKTLFPVGVGKIVRKPKPTPSRRPTTSGTTTRTPALPGGSLSEYDLYYRQPTSGLSTGTTAKSTASTAEQTFLFKLQVVLPDDAKPAAEEFMNALIENLRRALSIAFDDHIKKLDSQRILASEEADRAENKLVKMQNELREISGSRNLSRNVILSNISNLRRQLQDIIMHQASQEIYIQATTDQIAETQAKVAEQLRNDPITIELKGIVDIHTKSLENIQELVKEGAVSSAGVEVEEVLEKLARARIELAKRREQISKFAGGNKLDRLNTELAEYSLNMAQNKFSISNLEKQIAEAQDFLAKADTYELLSLKADIAKQNLEEALLWCARLGRNARLIQPPAVTVLGGS